MDCGDSARVHIHSIKLRRCKVSKIIEIDCCRDCPHLDYEYYNYSDTCDRLDGKHVGGDIDTLGRIHPDCPLEEVQDGN